jgi:hypothetical protein
MLEDPNDAMRSRLIVQQETHLDDAQSAGSDKSVSKQRVDLLDYQLYVVLNGFDSPLRRSSGLVHAHSFPSRS